MGFTDLFRKERAESALLIEVNPAAVVGAYVRYPEKSAPSVVYVKQVPVAARIGESLEAAVGRSLDALGQSLIQEGAPALSRYSGSGSVGKIFVSIDAPWQETVVHTEKFEQKTPFLFTEELVRNALKKAEELSGERVLTEERLVSALLNGYETREPYGKHAHRATVTMLRSFLKKDIIESITGVLRKLFHTDDVRPVAARSARYQAVRKAFPHERDALIIDINEPLVSFALVRSDSAPLLHEVPADLASDDAWLQKIVDSFADFAKAVPLPRTIFLVAREPEGKILKEALGRPDVRSLWLSEEVPSVIHILPSHMTGLVTSETTPAPDLPFLLFALYARAKAFDA